MAFVCRCRIKIQFVRRSIKNRPTGDNFIIDAIAWVCNVDFMPGCDLAWIRFSPLDRKHRREIPSAFRMVFPYEN